MSICAHGRPSVNRWRISAAAIIPPLPGLPCSSCRHVGFDRRFILFLPGHAPQRLAAARARDRKVVGQLVGGGENRSHFITEGHALGTSERGHVDDCVGIDFNGETKSVGQDEAPSASVFKTSMVMPLRIVSTSPASLHDHSAGSRHRCDRCDLDFERQAASRWKSRPSRSPRRSCPSSSPSWRHRT